MDKIIMRVMLTLAMFFTLASVIAGIIFMVRKLGPDSPGLIACGLVMLGLLWWAAGSIVK